MGERLPQWPYTCRAVLLPKDFGILVKRARHLLEPGKDHFKAGFSSSIGESLNSWNAQTSSVGASRV